MGKGRLRVVMVLPDSIYAFVRFSSLLRPFILFFVSPSSLTAHHLAYLLSLRLLSPTYVAVAHKKVRKE